MGVNEIIQIGNTIRELRLKKGYTQKQMSELTGIPYSTYSNYENNNREPSKDQLQKIANALNVPLDVFAETLMKQFHLNMLRVGLDGLQFGVVMQDVYDVLKGKNLELLERFYKLNEEGKEKAIERVGELTEIPRYTKRDIPAKYANNYSDTPEQDTPFELTRKNNGSDRERDEMIEKPTSGSD